MSKRLFDFLSSTGLMLVGVFLLLFGSLKFTSQKVQKAVAQLPVSRDRIIRETHGEMIRVFPVSKPAIPMPKDKSEYPGILTASATLVVDDRTNAILYGKNIKDTRSLASISKLMSALVLLDLPINWQTTIVVTTTDVDTSSHHINAGEKYSLDDLWKIALVGSSNSAINALVRASGLTTEQFVSKMNDKAVALNCNSLRFVEPTGLDSRNAGNAWDVARLLKLALRENKICQTLNLDEYDALPLNKKVSHKVWTTNLLLSNWVPNTFDKSLLVGKTGYISESGYNFVVKITGPKNHTIRVVVMGAAVAEARFTEARDLANWIFANYLWSDDAGYSKVASQ